MALEILASIDLGKNQLLNSALHVLATAPASPATGQIYFNSTDSKAYYYTGSTWVNISGDLTDFVIHATSTSYNSANGTSVDIGPAMYKVDSNGVINMFLKASSASNAGTMSAADKSKLDGATSTSGLSKLVIRDANGKARFTTPTDADHDETVSTVGYVKSKIAGLGNLEGGFAAGSSTNFPVGAGGTVKGDYWRVTTAGTVHGVSLTAGDVIIANQDGASVTDPDQWIFIAVQQDKATLTALGIVNIVGAAEINSATVGGDYPDHAVTVAAFLARTATTTRTGIVELATNTETQTGTDSNRAVTPASLSARTATETRTGIAEIATQAETDAGTDDARIVTPLKLQTKLNDSFTSKRAAISITNGNLTANAYTFNHQLGATDLNVDLWDVTSSEKFKVLAETIIVDSNNIRVEFAQGLGSRTVRVIVKA